MVTTHQEIHTGPIPTPDIIDGYERVLPGAADRIIRMAEVDAWLRLLSSFPPVRKVSLSQRAGHAAGEDGDAVPLAAAAAAAMVVVSDKRFRPHLPPRRYALAHGRSPAASSSPARRKKW